MSSRNNHAIRSRYSSHTPKPFQGFKARGAVRADGLEANKTLEKIKEMFKQIVKGEVKDGVQTSQS